jgi:hypothetical protein
MADCVLHAIGIEVADGCNLGMRMIEGHTEQIAHMHMVKVDPGYAPDLASLRHGVPLTRPADGFNPGRVQWDDLTPSRARFRLAGTAAGSSAWGS